MLVNSNFWVRSAFAQDLFLRMTLDSICKVAFGVEIGSLSPDLPDVQFAKDFDNAQAHISKRVVRPMFKILRALDIGEEHHFRIATNSVHSFAMDVIAKRRKEIAAAHDAGEEYVSYMSYRCLSRLRYQNLNMSQ